MSEVQPTRDYDLHDRLIAFAVRVLHTVESLPDNRLARHVTDQLVRTGTSPASNYAEAQSAESRKDFIHKLKVGLKELRETLVWLNVVQRTPLIGHPERLNEIIQENRELIAIFVASIVTARRNLTAGGKKQNDPP